jgi:hypothetical protein
VVIDEIGAEAMLPIPDSFDRCKEATEFSYMCPTCVSFKIDGRRNELGAKIASKQ